MIDQSTQTPDLVETSVTEKGMRRDAEMLSTPD